MKHQHSRRPVFLSRQDDGVALFDDTFYCIWEVARSGNCFECFKRKVSATYQHGSNASKNYSLNDLKKRKNVHVEDVVQYLKVGTLVNRYKTKAVKYQSGCCNRGFLEDVRWLFMLGLWETICQKSDAGNWLNALTAKLRLCSKPITCFDNLLGAGQCDAFSLIYVICSRSWLSPGWWP